MQRLTEARLEELAPEVIRPGYDRAVIRPGIVHIGIGAFHRAHMAVYVDATLAADPSWAIIGASLRRPDTSNALVPQDCLYSLHIRDGEGTKVRVIGAITDIIDASGDSGPLLDLIAGPEIRIVSLTVTEKGYCHDPATGRLSLDHPDIKRDLAQPDQPVSLPGILVAAADKRRAAGHGGFTVVSCDNLSGNGLIARAVVLDLARQRDPALGDWIESHVTFPSTMVDRIVPATSDSDRAEANARLGLDDAWPVLTEPFSQWVVEDNFAAGRPELGSVGVQLVTDVEPFELMKLRMLNGAHSTMAYLGQLAGHELVSEAVADTDIRALLDRLMTGEVMPTLNVPEIDLPAYRDQLLARFANPALQHRLAQIAMDGSQKLPQRILAPLRERLERGENVDLLCLSLAGWIAFLIREIRVKGGAPADPLATRLSDAVGPEGDAAQTVARIFALREIFGTELSENTAIQQKVARHLDLLLTDDVSAAIKAALAGTAQ